LDRFTPEGIAIDPWGTTSHKGFQELTNFYDAFVGPREIHFSDKMIKTNGLSQWRHSTIRIQQGSTILHVPAYIHYQLTQYEGQLKMQHMHAYWYMPGVRMSFCAKLSQSPSILRHLGLRKAWAFFRSGMSDTIGESILEPKPDIYNPKEKDPIKEGTCQVFHIDMTGKRLLVDQENLSAIIYEDSIVSGYAVVSRTSLHLVDRQTGIEGISVTSYAKNRGMIRIEFYEGRE